jgi:hypothetical protein
MGLGDWLGAFVRRGNDDAAYEPPPHTAPLVVPARGGVFDLHVIVHLAWSCPTLRNAELEKLALDRCDGALYLIGRDIRDLARDLDPLDPGGAQDALNAHRRINGALCYRRNGEMIKCQARVQVFLDPRLREQLMPFATERVELDECHRVNLQRDRQIQERAQRWLEAIQRLEGFDHLGKDERQFLLRYAASLVDEDFAKVINELAKDRYVRYEQFVEVLRNTRREHERVGLFEFASAYDKALQTFCRQMGVDPAAFLLSDFGERPLSGQRAS